jgi:hypothetical protein
VQRSRTAAEISSAWPFRLGSRGNSSLAGHFGRRADKRANQHANNYVEHYKAPVRFGLGGVPLGNEFAVITEKDA